MSLLNKASLIQIPSGYKDGTLYSAKPTNGDGDFTFSRGSNLAATRVNSDGLIEKGRENLLLQSNQFDTTWLTIRSSVSSGATDPFGGSNAWSFLTDNTANDQHYIYQGISQSGVGTLSIYAKANGYNWLRLRLPSEEAYFDVANGVTGSSTTGISASITDVSNGWYRCEVAFSDMSTNPNVFMHIAENDGDIIIDGTPSGNDGLYIYSAQLESGLVATNIIETGASTAQAGILEDMPRLDYSGGATCPSLLLEPQRSNLLTHSEYFDDWTKSGSGTITVNYATSPEGLKNAYRYQAPSGSRYVVYKNIGVSNGVTYTLSLYAKSLSGTQKIRIGADNGCVNPQGAETFDIGTEWVRVETQITSTQTSWNIYFDNVESGTTCTGTYLSADLLIYGFQVEAGSYPTSYIPTYGASVTRGADFSDNNDIVSNSISFGANDDFTLFYEGSFDDLSSGFNMIMGGGNQSTGNDYKNYWWLFNATSVRINGDSEVLMASASMSLTDNTNHKLLVKRDGSIIDFFVDGSKLTTTQSTPNTAFVFRSLGWSYTNAVYKVSGDIKQALIFNSALSDDECEQLTTL